MKIRLDFVTNSSSSSFVCCNCGNFKEEWDFDIYICEKNDSHVICRKCKSDIEDIIHRDGCPVCNFGIIPKYNILSYISIVYPEVLSKYTEEIRSRFKSSDEFDNFLNNKSI